MKHFTTLYLNFALLALPASAALSLSWNAEGLGNGSLAAWAPDFKLTAKDIDWQGSGNKQSGTTNFANVGDWVSSPSYIFDDNGSGDDSWNNILGDSITDADATWELVFRPGNFTGNHTLFNTGGNGDGTAFVLEGSFLEFRFQDGPSADQQAFATFDLSTLGTATDFYHVVGIADLDNPGDEGTAILYVNGQFRSQASSDNSGTGGINDWDGGDDAELGRGKNIPGANPYNPDAFDGDISIFNFYESQILTPGEISANYGALIPEPSAFALSLLGLGGLILRRR